MHYVILIILPVSVAGLCIVIVEIVHLISEHRKDKNKKGEKSKGGHD